MQYRRIGGKHLKGFIKDYRQELLSDIWMMPPLYHRVWQYLKYSANHIEGRIPMSDGTFKTIMPGQHLTSIRNIAEGVSWYERGVKKVPNPRTISRILDWLKKQSMINIDRGNGNRQYTLITLLNWGLYQSKDNRSNSRYTESASGAQQSVHINKNVKNVKNDKEDPTTTDAREEKNKKDAIVFYENNIGMLRPIISQELLDWINDMGDVMVIEALKRAISQNKPSWGYAKGILNSWYSKGIKTVEQAEAEDVEFRNRHQSRFSLQRQSEVIPDWFGKQESQKQQEAEEIDEQEEKKIISMLKRHSSGVNNG